MEPEEIESEAEEQPMPVAKCPRCGADWYIVGVGFCGGCETR